MWTLAALALLLAPTPEPVSIYIGPQVKDGFVDTDKGVSDSIKDLRKELGKKRDLRVVDDESTAQLKLYVVARGFGAADGDGVTIAMPGSPGLGIHVATKTRYVRALLRVGDYERPFVAEDREYDTWGRCAKLLARDLSEWVTANRSRITAPE
jgi:hypothetical protein